MKVQYTIEGIIDIDYSRQGHPVTVDNERIDTILKKAYKETCNDNVKVIIEFNTKEEN